MTQPMNEEAEGSTPPAPSSGGNPHSDLVVSTAFDTIALPGRLQYQAWRESIGTIFDVRGNPCGDDAAYCAGVRATIADEVLVSRCFAQKQVFERSALRPLQDGIETLMIQVFTKGSVSITDEARAYAGTDTLTAFDLARPMETQNSDFDLVSIFIPPCEHFHSAG